MAEPNTVNGVHHKNGVAPHRQPSTDGQSVIHHDLPGEEGGSFVVGETLPAGGKLGSEGRYELIERIAHGGMGVVYRARDRALNRIVAIKVLRSRFLENPDMVRRFMDEAQISARLQHPSILPIYEVGTLADGRPFIAMKFIHGRTLTLLLRERSNPAQDLTRFLHIFQQLCQAVAYAHSQGVIHRDLKPDNVMVGEFGEVLLMDWGLAKYVKQSESRFEIDLSPPEELDSSVDLMGENHSRTEILPSPPPAADGVEPFSDVGRVMGTLQYMPPEQALGKLDLLDERADVFALGGHPLAHPDRAICLYRFSGRDAG